MTFIKGNQWHMLEPTTKPHIKNGLQFVQARCGVSILASSKTVTYTNETVCSHCANPVPETVSRIKKMSA